MPFLSNIASFTKSFEPIPIEYFIRWRDTYISRSTRFHLNNDKLKVDLSLDDYFITFAASDILGVVKNASDKQFLTVQFICQNDGNSQYKKMSLAICIMDNFNRVSDFVLPINFSPNPAPDIEKMKENYRYRKNTILNSSQNFKNKEEFQKDEDGISHKISTEIISFLEEAINAQKNINVIFAKIPYYETDSKIPSDRRDKMTVVYTMEGVDFMDDDLLRNSLKNVKLFDLGSTCCPPQ